MKLDTLSLLRDVALDTLRPTWSASSARLVGALTAEDVAAFAAPRLGPVMDDGDPAVVGPAVNWANGRGAAARWRDALALSPRPRRVADTDPWSGAALSPRLHHRLTRRFRAPGIDPRASWEAARFGSFPARALACRDTARASEAAALQAEALSFLARNPPRYGLHWSNAMEVGVRIANLLVGWDILQAAGHADPRFTRWLTDAAVDHARYIMANLEVSPSGNGNHYLCDLAGLLTVALYLRDPGRDSMGAFATRELLIEIARQFGDDGGNIEGSVPYHRFSLDVCAWGLAIVKRWARQGGAVDAEALSLAESRLAAAAAFLVGAARDDGRLPQIGDNDSGLFVSIDIVSHAPASAFAGAPETESDATLDSRPTVDVAACLLLGAQPRSQTGLLVQRIAGGGAKPVVPAAPFRPSAAVVADSPFPVIEDPESLVISIRLPPEREAPTSCTVFPGFGLVILRSKGIHLAFRCGQATKASRGHEHFDQLSLELSVGAETWIEDPGTLIYLGSPETRRAYRSVRAHFAPQPADPTAEPGIAGPGLFRMKGDARPTLLSARANHIAAWHVGYGWPVLRQVWLEPGLLIVADTASAGRLGPPLDPATIVPAAARYARPRSGRDPGREALSQAMQWSRQPGVWRAPDGGAQGAA